RTRFLRRVAQRAGGEPDEAGQWVRTVLTAVSHGVPEAVMVEVAIAVPEDLLDLIPGARGGPATIGPREDLRGAGSGAARQSGRAHPRVVDGRGAGEGRALHRQEGCRGGGRVLDGGRARGAAARGGGNFPAVLPGPGAHAGAGPHAGGRLPTSVTL